MKSRPIIFDGESVRAILAGHEDAGGRPVKKLYTTKGREADPEHLKARILNAVEVNALTGCWVWKRHTNNFGYGTLTVAHRRVLVHRLAFQLWSGPLTADKPHVCHRCDRPSCVNPEHLFAGSRSDNMRDATAKGRLVPPSVRKVGVTNGAAKLTESQVLEIRELLASGEPQEAIAIQFGISQSMVSNDSAGLAEFTRKAYPSGGIRCPYGAPGDELWVRETFQFEDCSEYGFDLADAPEGPSRTEDGVTLIPRYRATAPDTVLEVVPNDTGDPDNGMRWRSPIHMPRWASRLTLRVTDVRVERLQEISEADAIAEGAEPTVYTALDVLRADSDSPEDQLLRALGPGQTSRKFEFEIRWDEINKKRGFGWDVNPWVWVVAFAKLEELTDE